MLTSTLTSVLNKLDGRSIVTLVGFVFSIFSFLVDRSNSRESSKRRHEKELEQESRQRELEHLDRQLRDLYGPLFGMVSSSYGIYQAFRASASHLLKLPEGVKYRSRNIWKAGQATPELIQLHRTWMTKIMSPIYTDIEDRINKNGDLFIGSEYPEEFQMMLTHICSWRLLMASWEGKNALSDPTELAYERNFAHLRFPKAYKVYVEICYEMLQARRATLLSQLRPGEVSVSKEARKNRTAETDSSAGNSQKAVSSEAAYASMRRRLSGPRDSTGVQQLNLSPNTFKSKYF